MFSDISFIGIMPGRISFIGTVYVPNTQIYLLLTSDMLPAFCR